MLTIHKIPLALLIAASASASAAGSTEADSAKAQYDAERARCMSGTTGQDQASCLRSAGAAYDELRGNRLTNPNTAYDANAMARCGSLPAPDRSDCEARVRAGTTNASVKEGGDLKETVTVIPPRQ